MTRAGIAEIIRTAEISPCGRYRYRLERRWTPGLGLLLPFIMLNPSTADGTVDDPTIRRCMGFALREGYHGIVVGNLYAFRATKPSDLRKAAFPFGPDNHQALSRIIAETDQFVCAWGAGTWEPLPAAVEAALRKKGMCLGRTSHGHPRHPLYVRADQPLEPWP
jgi:hypothetical protein